MKIVTAIHDHKMNTFDGVMIFDNASVAIRHFGDMCAKVPLIAEHREDFELYQIGTFDIESGNIESIGKVVSLCTALSVQPE